MRSTASALAILMFTACSAAPSDGDDPVTSASAELEPSRPTIRPESEQPSRDDTVTGVLGADDVEGGCAYLQTPDGARVEVRFPRGWHLSISPLELTGPSGVVVARGGDEITVRGEVTTEVASVCQLGPIFRATSVER